MEDYKVEMKDLNPTFDPSTPSLSIVYNMENIISIFPLAPGLDTQTMRGPVSLPISVISRRGRHCPVFLLYVGSHVALRKELDFTIASSSSRPS